MEDLKEKVKILRSKGKTYSEIQKEVGKKIPKGTLSYWCAGVSLPDFYNSKVEKLNFKNLSKGREIAQQLTKTRRKEFLEDVKKKNIHLVTKAKNDSDVKKIILTILYLGEGAKWRSHRGLMLGSSDGNILILYLNLLDQIYGIKRTSVKAWISFRADQDINKLTNFWSKKLRISKNQFYKSKPDSRTKGKPTKRKEYKGVCVIYCAGTKIQLELETIARMLAVSI